MAEVVVLLAEQRGEKQLGSNVARRLRKQGKVPAVIYGHGEGTAHLAVDHDALLKAIRHGARILDIQQGEAKQSALLSDIQWDPLGHDILHVDFTRVSADERITLDVSVMLRGTAPGLAAGGVIVQPLHTLEIECLPTNIPESIRVNVGELQLNQAIYVRDLKLPEGTIVKNDPEAIIVQVVPKVEDVEAATPGEMAEPELIGRKAEKEEGEE